MSELEKFKSHVEAFILKNELTPTKFGSKFAGDPNFVFSLREGREPRSSTRQKVENSMLGSSANEDAA